MLGISGPEFLVIVLVAVIVIGPQRLPEYTRKLTHAVRRLRVFLDDAKEQIAEEVGPELADLDLSDLDPRNYDPRKIVRDALGEDLDAIRRDLASPLQSVARTAKETSDEAAGALSSQAGSKSLSTMIEDKAQEARAARSGSEHPEGGAGRSSEPAEAAEPIASSADATAREPEPQGGDAESDAENASNAPEVPKAPERPGPAVVPSSLAEGKTEPAAPRPVSPRDIVRAANAAARTRSQAATIPVEADA